MGDLAANLDFLNQIYASSRRQSGGHVCDAGQSVLANGHSP